MRFKLFLIFSLLFLFPLVSSSGIAYIGDDPLVITKTFGQDKQMTITVMNQESFDFTNLSFESNPYITMTEIPLLQSGQSVNFTATIVSEVPYNGQVKIQGFYEAQLGQQFITHNIDVDYYDGLSECDKSIVVGDLINWTNSVSDDIEITAPYNLWTNNIIQEGTSASHTFANPETFSYYFSRYGFKFTNTCTITVLDDQGYINDPSLDAVFVLNLTVIYPETNISINIPTTSYSINAFSSSDGVLSITNNGNSVAKNVQLGGEWFSFNINIFDINPGETKGVVYTISPLLTTTNETNQTYIKEMTISGNFNSFSQDFSIFVPYKKIEDGQFIEGMTLIEWIEVFCESNPYHEMCVGSTTVIIQNGSDQDFNVTFQQSQVRSLFEFQFMEADNREEFENYMKELMYQYQQNLTNVSASIVSMEIGITETQKEQEKMSNNLFLFFLGTFTLICLGFIYKYREHILKMQKYMRFRYQKSFKK